MSYHPYFRGKRNELLCLRENSDLIARSRFVPIIEPVRPELAPFKRSVDSLVQSGARAFVIANPGCGPLKGGLPDSLRDYVQELVDRDCGVNWLVRPGSSTVHQDRARKNKKSGFLHDAVMQVSQADLVQEHRRELFDCHVFLDTRDAGEVYRDSFKGSARVLVRDGFRKKKNADYLEPSVESFSDLHLTYRRSGFQGYGDFLPIGDSYSDKGGPAYAVAIHLTFSHPDFDGAVFVQHFVSDSNDTSEDPGIKFREALAKMVVEVSQKKTLIPATSAVREFISLHERGHYPGLGYAKKLIMQHHLELMATIRRDA